MESDSSNIASLDFDTHIQHNPFAKFKGQSISKEDLLLIMHTYKMDPYEKNLCWIALREITKAYNKETFEYLWKSAKNDEMKQITKDEEESETSDPNLFTYSTINGDKVIMHLDSGIKLFDSESGELLEIFKWLKFRIYLRFQKSDEWYYKYQLNSNSGIVLFDTMKNELLKRYSYKKSTFRTILNSVLEQYIESIPPIHPEPILGFTETGWKLPHNSIFCFTEAIRKKCLAQLTKVFEQPITIEEIESTKKKVQLLYQATTISHKGIIWAWATVSPFMHILSQHTDLAVLISLFSPEGTTFKSAAARMVTAKFYGNIKDISNASNFTSSSRTDGHLTASTYAFIIDEADTLPESQVSKVKGLSTSPHQSAERKGAGIAGQDFSMDDEYCNVFGLVFNKSAVWYKDTAFLQRVLNLNITKTKADPNWKQYLNALPTGAFGRAHYFLSKDWVAVDLFQRYDQQPHSTYLEGRGDTIYRTIQLGKQLLHDFFEIDVDISELESCIDETLMQESDQLLEYVQVLIENGKYKWVTEKCTGFFDPGTHKWIRNPVCEAYPRNCSKGGYVLTYEHIRDLQTQIDSKTPITLEQMFQQLKYSRLGKSNQLECDRYHIYVLEKNGDTMVQEQKKIVRGIFIPKDVYEACFTSSVYDPKTKGKVIELDSGQLK